MSRKEGVSYLFGHIGRERGLKVERRVFQVVSESIGSPDCPQWLRGCRRANRRDDWRGIDFWFDTDDVGAIGVQIKTSKWGVEMAKRKHPRVPVVCVLPGSSAQEILGTCLLVVARQRDFYLQARECPPPGSDNLFS